MVCEVLKEGEDIGRRGRLRSVAEWLRQFQRVEGLKSKDIDAAR